MDGYVKNVRLSSTKRSTQVVAAGAFILTILFMIPYLQIRETGIFDRFLLKSPTDIVPSEAYFQVDVNETAGLWPYRVFKSAPWTPPHLEITRHQEGVDLADGLLFLNPKNSDGECLKQSAPFIMSPDDNELVYAFNDTTGTNGFRVQHIDNEKHLTFWRGLSVLGHGFGDVVLLNQSYSEVVLDLDPSLDLVKNMRLGRQTPGNTDFHEQEMTSRGTILVTAYNNTPYDLSALGGPRDGWVSDSQFHEIDVKTEKVVFSWSALKHISMKDSMLPLESYMGKSSKMSPYDFFHINSVQEVDGNFLVTARHTWAVYLVSGEDGHVIWEISSRGDGGSFGPLSEEAQFHWAHNGRAHNVTENGMEISIFDNHYMQDENKTMPTRGLVFGISLPPDPHRSPTFLRIVQAPDSPLHSLSQGNYEPELSNGNQLIGYGPVPVVREFGPAWNGSQLLWEARFGFDLGAHSYRAYKLEWHATPLDWDPSLVVEVEQDTFTGYVSWNGATDVDAWNIYVGQGKEKVTKLAGKATKKGFETMFEIPMVGKSCVQVAAVKASREVRLSNVVCPTGKSEA